MTSSGITRRQWLMASGCLGLSLGLTSAAESPGFGVINMEPYPPQCRRGISASEEREPTLHGR